MTTTRWQRLDAEHWVLRLLRAQTFLLSLWTVWALSGTWLAGVVWLTLFPAAVTALWGWVASGWRRERPWAWWVAAVFAGMRFAGFGSGLLAGTLPWPLLAVLAFDALLLTILFHRDARARVDAPAEPPAGPRPQPAQRWSGQPS